MTAILTKPMPIRDTLSGRWQVPLFAASLACFAGVMYRFASSHRAINFTERVTTIERLRDAGEFARASAYIRYVLENTSYGTQEGGVLQQWMARIISDAESRLTVHDPVNARSIITNYQAVMNSGAALAGQDWQRFGWAADWLNLFEEASNAYRMALEAGVERPDRIRRRLIEIGEPHDGASAEQLVTDLELIRKDERASPDNYAWAFKRLSELRLEAGDSAAVDELIAAARTRLEGQAEKAVISLVEAEALIARGGIGEAEVLLRQDVEDPTVPRDVLWAEMSQQLARLVQTDGRPQEALALYEDVLGSFRSGPLRAACEAGRAECLASLERYDASLEAFEGLREWMDQPLLRRFVDRKAVRATTTAIGESALQRELAELAVKYLRFALSLDPGMDWEARAWYESRIAQGLVTLARQAREGAGGATPDEERSRALYGEAGETYLRLSEIQIPEEAQSARSMELAADQFEEAGQPDRAVEVLESYVRLHSTGERRQGALYRLGQAHQAAGRYENAIEAYDEIIQKYMPLPDALRSLVAMAMCEIRLRGDREKRGVERLIEIVDDRGPAALFDYRAEEYREALFTLAEYYVRAGDDAAPGRWEKAITRLEDAIALYPEDARVTQLRFKLGDAYRESGRQLEEKSRSVADVRSRAEARAEVERRVFRGLEQYESVIRALAPRDDRALGDPERTQLQASYLYRGDCLFDLHRYAEAIEAYQEAAWRFDGTTSAVAASMQIVHCHQRLGQAGAARAALQRVQWLLQTLPESAFDGEKYGMTRPYWETLANRMAQSSYFARGS